jgi:hypothetical protein
MYESIHPCVSHLGLRWGMCAKASSDHEVHLGSCGLYANLREQRLSFSTMAAMEGQCLLTPSSFGAFSPSALSATHEWISSFCRSVVLGRTQATLWHRRWVQSPMIPGKTDTSYGRRIVPMGQRFGYDCLYGLQSVAVLSGGRSHSLSSASLQSSS